MATQRIRHLRPLLRPISHLHPTSPPPCKPFSTSAPSLAVRSTGPSPTVNHNAQRFRSRQKEHPEAYKIALIVPIEYVLSAHKAKQIPFRPQTFYKVIEASLPHTGSRPSRAFGEFICREFAMSAKDFGAIAVFLVKTLPHVNGRDMDEGKRNVRLELMYTILHSAALLGDPAAVVLHFQLLDGITRKLGRKTEQVEAHEAFQRVQEVARLGNSAALAVVASTLELKGDRKGALEAYLKCGEAGDGDGYAHGGQLVKTLKGDREEAMRLWRKGAVSLDSAKCYYNLSLEIDPKDPEHEKFMLKAAASGVRGAAHNLGFYYSKLAEKKNIPLAKEWYCVSQGEGMVESVYNLLALLKKEGKTEELSTWVGADMFVKAKLSDVQELKARERFAGPNPGQAAIQ
ncbi:hypothetical protein BZA05DRAFT_402114 [Tricharina praecox]|uniref:uncharacterized protein n=1 Tax=Tricharina praecox TaxID=43433 RepID=UPI00221FC175|nr:uncharacterized protein BZA05DRAFT_402114 [Tricharina praecox]KAI5849065.1 hypothetical protein BZA05DRAFT_402114 [Tricharina praecox]